MMKKSKLILFLLLTISSLIAQDLSKLTPEQLDMYKKYMATKNAPATVEAPVSKGTVEARTIQDPVSVKIPAIQPDTKLNVFGSYLFSSQNLTFEPSLNIPTPQNYILGTYDEVVVDISGLYEANYKLKVSPEGLIQIPNIGQVKVSGIKIEDATRLIRNQLSKVYTGIASGETKVNVTLGNIRSIKVTIVGEAVRPGTYTLPSLATALNAIYSCGGPSEIGSMRNIKVIRAGKVITTLDIYRFLVNGVLDDNVGLHDGDIIKINPYQMKVTLTGMVKHTGIFEGIPGETLLDMITYAGGLTDKASTDKITVFRLTDTEKTVVNVLKDQIATFKIKSGDSYVINSIYEKFDNRVDITGSVYRPGAYALEQGLSVKKLIEMAAGLKEDAYLNMASIIRKKENQVPEIISFNPGEIMSGNAPDILLQKDDQVEIQSLFDFKESEKATITGAVKSPGTYQLIDNVSLKDIIYKAKGFTEMAATDLIELVRPVKDKDSLLMFANKSNVFRFSMDKNMNFINGSADVLLKNGDQVIVRTIPGYEGIKMVSIEGEVINPGSYNITGKTERISDLVKRAGGFTSYAFQPGAFLIRTEKPTAVEQKLNRIMETNSQEQIKSDQSNSSIDVSMLKSAGATSVKGFAAMDSIQQKLSGVDVIKAISVREGVVGIDLKKIMTQPGSKYDLILEEGDVIFIPRELQTVRVLGKVLFPTYVSYDPDMNFKGYISSAGGFSQSANKYKIFVLYPNGTARSTKSFLGIKFYPRVLPGSRIVVPEKPVEIKTRMSTAETVGILTSVTSMAALIYSVLKSSGL
jgi:protein involved in polysaccharide export with SLBB domain